MLLIFVFLALLHTSICTRFAVHFDIEPASLPEWESNPQSIMNQYLDLLQNVSFAKGPQLDLVVDTSTSFNFRNVTRHNITKPLYQWVLDYVDISMLMDYRNFISGSSGLITLAQPSVEYATLVGKKVIVGVETADESPSYITFFGTNTTHLETILEQVKGTFASQEGFGGVAVHDLKAYQLLTNTQPAQVCTDKALFVWQATVATNVSEYIKFARGRCVTTTYFESEDLIKNDNATLLNFVNASMKNGINTQFLFGSAAWTRMDKHAYVVSLVEKAKALIKSFPEPSPISTSSTKTTTSNLSSTSTSPSPNFHYLLFLWIVGIINPVLSGPHKTQKHSGWLDITFN